MSCPMRSRSWTPARRAEVGGGGPRLEQSRLPRARLELGCASGDPVQEERSPGGLSGVGLQQSQPRGAALGAAERVARDCDPLGEDSLKLHGRPLPGRRSRLAQALTGPSTAYDAARPEFCAIRALVKERL